MTPETASRRRQSFGHRDSPGPRTNNGALLRRQQHLAASRRQVGHGPQTSPAGTGSCGRRVRTRPMVASKDNFSPTYSGTIPNDRTPASRTFRGNPGLLSGKTTVRGKRRDQSEWRDGRRRTRALAAGPSRGSRLLPVRRPAEIPLSFAQRRLCVDQGSVTTTRC